MVKKSFYYLSLLLFLSSCGSGWVPLDIDHKLGELSNSEISSNNQLFKVLDEEEYPESYGKIQKIRDKILASGELEHQSDFNWEIKIIHDDSVLNAFCLPGGYIYVYTGLIHYLDSEAALAGVLGHEMAHADRRHSVNQLIKNTGLSLFLQLVFGTDNASLVNFGANLLSLSFSRSDESEADMKSVEYLYKTDYDARGAALFFEKLQREKKDEALVEFISTHPNPDNRVSKIHEKWKNLGGQKGLLYTKEYQKMKRELP